MIGEGARQIAPALFALANLIVALLAVKTLALRGGGTLLPAPAPSAAR